MAKKKPDGDPTPEPDALASLELEAPENPAEPESPETPVAGADEPALIPNVASTMRGWGYEVADDATEDDIRSHLESLEERASKYEEAQQRLAALEAQRAQWEQQRPAPEPKPAAQTTEADDDEIPERPQLDRFTHAVLLAAKQNGKLTDVGGMLTSDDASLQGHIQVYNKHAAELDAYDREWGDPRKVAQHIYEKRLAKDREELKKQLLDEVRGTLTQRDRDSYFDQFKAQNAEWLFDPTKTKFTDVGEAFAREVDDLVQRGFGPEEAIKRAKAYVQAETGKTPWSKEPPAEPETPEKRVVKFRNRLSKNNGSTLPTSPVSRPGAGVGTRKFDGNINHHLDATFDALMNAQVAER